MINTIIEEGKRLQAKTIEKEIRKYLNKANTKAKIKKYKLTISNYDIEFAASRLKGLNDALLDGRSVFAVCDKHPPGNLDTGRHHFSVYYVGKKSIVLGVYLYDIMRLLGATKNTRNSGLRYYTWSSGAIGMSRIQNATSGLSRFLKDIGGCAFQLDVI